MLTKVYSGITELANGTTALCGPLRLPGANLVQTHYPIRALGPVNIDRYGKSYVVSFEIVKLHASPFAAALFRASHHKELANVANLVIRQTTGTDVLVVTIGDAAWEQVDPILLGLSTRTRYRVTGGPLSVQESSTVEALENTDGTALHNTEGTGLTLQ